MNDAENINRLHLKLLPDFLWLLYQRLRRRGFVLGPEDYSALQQSLRLGFGWSSQGALRELCGSLWAKSVREREALFALFDQLVPQEEGWEFEGDEAIGDEVIGELGEVRTERIDEPAKSEAETFGVLLNIHASFKHATTFR